MSLDVCVVDSHTNIEFLQYHNQYPGLHTVGLYLAMGCGFSYSWDPTQKTLLPCKYPFCARVVPAANIEAVIEHTDSQPPITTACSCCANEFTFTPERSTMKTSTIELCYQNL